eukprot:4564219-Pyramimonas_sp.AAC.1
MGPLFLEPLLGPRARGPLLPSSAALFGGVLITSMRFCIVRGAENVCLARKCPNPAEWPPLPWAAGAYRCDS